VDFELDADQVALQEALRRQLAGQFPIEVVRGLEASAGVDRLRWRQLAEAGVFSLRLPEADGGVGLGQAEAVLVFEELGRALVPGPLVATHLAAGLVEGAATGDRVVGLVEASGDEPLLVEHLGALDLLVVVDDDGLWGLDPTALEAEPVTTPLDPLTPLHRVSRPSGALLAGPDAAAGWRRVGAALTAALQLGIAEAVTDAAVAYAKERVQFDRPIGSFQAVKHLLADMLVRAELARAATYAAGVTIDDPVVGDPEQAAGTAKVVAGDAAVLNGKTCIQVHGGMGFTWEVDAHLFLKRALVLETHFGSADAHAERLAGRL
jgi:alkylation response protein AidB-like acyl-CoA dehydrogenase